VDVPIPSPPEAAQCAPILARVSSLLIPFLSRGLVSLIKRNDPHQRFRKSGKPSLDVPGLDSCLQSTYGCLETRFCEVGDAII
jgi:hypothetical protein